jgi:hypothetical protein
MINFKTYMVGQQAQVENQEVQKFYRQKIV